MPTVHVGGKGATRVICKTGFNLPDTGHVFNGAGSRLLVYSAPSLVVNIAYNQAVVRVTGNATFGRDLRVHGTIFVRAVPGPVFIVDGKPQQTWTTNVHLTPTIPMAEHPPPDPYPMAAMASEDQMRVIEDEPVSGPELPTPVDLPERLTRFYERLDLYRQRVEALERRRASPPA